MKRNRWVWSICALLLGLFVLSEIVPLGLSVLAANSESARIENNGSRLVAKVENVDNPSYQWQIGETKDGTFTNIEGDAAKGFFYDITTADEGKYIRVVVNENTISEPVGPIGKLVVFDIAKESVTLNSTYSGKDSKGESVTGTHAASNIYVIGQSNPETMTKNTISFAGKHENAPFDVTLDNVNMGCTPTNHSQTPGASGTDTPTTGHISIPANNDDVKNVTLRLKGENSLRNITYYIGSDTSTPQSNVKSSLKITNINGDGEVEGGSLYIPKKLTADEIEDFVKTSTNYNHWNAGIGGLDSTSLMQNFEIAGGKIQVVTTLGDNCTAIGAGGNGYCQMEISGGEVIAHCNGTGAAIGGGIGWNAAGGRADILISGGSVYAKNHGNITEKIDGQTEMVGGVAIGSGSSFKAGGTEGAVTITGGTVEAYGTFGNGIGGGNSSTSAGGKATINISGGTVIASSIGGGNSRKGTGGEAKVTIDGSANVTLTQGIGGGDSYSGDGGEATITVNAGTMLCGGVIGGGNGGGTGNGGKAIVTVNSGILTATSIGGGTGSVGGNGGAAEIVIEGGLIETGSIGGGSTKNPTGKLGYAKAVIADGDISGQFLMVAGGTEPCTFTMTGGTLHGVDTVNTTGKYVQENGAAVFMDDPNGTVVISGGKIEDCQAVNGGAIYMTAGTFILSDTGSIQNCSATANGGAVYLGGGTMNVNGGTITENYAEANGGAIYLGGGNMKVTNGVLSKNETQLNGGAAYINGGNFEITGGSILQNTAQINGGGITVNNGNYRMLGGFVDQNQAKEGDGGGIYVSSDDSSEVKVEVLSGSVSNNAAKGSGGALAVVGKENATKDINVIIGVNELHRDENNNKINCNHGAEGIYACPIMGGNQAQISGGAILVTGNDNAKLNIYCLQRANNYAVQETELSDFMKVAGGTVVISSAANITGAGAQHGDIYIPDTVYVTGGKMDIWGAMTNPYIEDIITVDIKKEGDHFIDHRTNDGYYLLCYYENFEDPETHIVTGQYKQKMIKHGEKEKISGNIYDHPGYTIKGWNTDAKEEHYWNQGEAPEGEEKDTGWYQVDKEYKFDNDPIGNLKIYAIWNANGYTVYFDPNCQEYDGSMVAVNFNYDEEKTIPKNLYKRDGYIFKGWCTEPDGSAELYADQQKVKNLTNKKGEAITLYAQWEKCEHGLDRTYTYTVIDDGTTLKRTCSCEGYHETASLSAENKVYNREEQPIKVNYSSQSWRPTVYYQQENNNAFSGIPKNAGTYTASVTDGGETASVTYVIEKAEQPAPNIPEYSADIQSGEEKSLLKVKPVQDSVISQPGSNLYDETYDSVKEYRIVYYEGTTEKVKGWVEGTTPLIEGQYAASFDLDVALTNYAVYARYSEGTNYKASQETAAETVYFFSGNVKLFVKNGEGVRNLAKEAKGGNNVVANGIALTIQLEEGYYFPDSYGNPTIRTQKFNEPDVSHTTQAEIGSNTSTKVEEKVHAITGIPGECEIYIELPDAKRIPGVTANVTEKQVYHSVTADSASISRDSAYTLYFEILNYDPSAYSQLAVYFSQDLPVGTNVILVDKGTDRYYWTEIQNTTNHLVVLPGAGQPSSPLTQMGTANEKFAISNLDEKGYTTVKLQLIVDFSEVEEGARMNAGNQMFTTLATTRTNGAPELTAAVATEIHNEQKYNISRILIPENETANRLRCEVEPSGGIVSKWDHRQAALVLTPASSTELSADVSIRYKIGDRTGTAYRNAEGKFVLSLGDLNTTEVEIWLMSSLFSENRVEYEFSAEWIASQSIAEKAVKNGELLASMASVNISNNIEVAPSIQISTDQKYYDKTQTGNVVATVNWKNITAEHKMKVTLMIKNEQDVYTSTGLSWDIEGIGAASHQFVVTIPSNMIIRELDSYCLNIVVDAALITVAEDNCYFITEKEIT